MPIRFGVKWGGVPELLTRLSSSDPINEGLKEGRETYKDALKTYPPPKLDSDYVRTGFLRDHWRVKAVSMTQFRAENSAPYASFVQGKFRRRYHYATGWRNPTEIFRQISKVVLAQIRGGIVKAARSGKTSFPGGKL